MNLNQSLATTGKHLRRGPLAGAVSRELIRRHSYRPLFESLEVRLAPAVINWTNPAGGDWDTASNWQGGVLPGPSDEAVIDEPGNVTITHSTSATDTVASLSASDPIAFSAGTLTVTGSLSDSSGVTLSGGALANAIIAAGTSVSGSGTLSGVTLAGTINNRAGGTLTITNGLTLSNGVVELGHIAMLDFSGTQTLGGSGDVEFTDDVNDGGFTGTYINASNVLTVAAGVTLEALPGSGSTATLGTISADESGSSVVFDGTISAAASGSTIVINGQGADGGWTNKGTIESVSGGTLVLDQSFSPGTWSNAGTITTSDSTVDLGGNFATAGLGTFTNNGSAVYLTGTLTNTGATLALNDTTGPLLLTGSGEIIGGIVTTTGNAVLSGDDSDGGTLNDVTMAGTLQDTASGLLTIINGLTLGNGTVNGVVELANSARLEFSGTQTLGGTGDVQFADHVYTGTFMDLTGANSVLTVAAGVTLEALPGSGATTALGTISADEAGSSIVFDGTVSAAASGSAIVINGQGADGSWTNNGTIESVSGGTLVLDQPNSPDTWSNAGTITTTASTVDLGGNFAVADLATFTNNGSTINLTGTLDNTGTTLALDAATGAWQIAGGTINGGTVTTAGSGVLMNAPSGVGTLNGVTLAGTLELDEGGQLAITNGLTLNNGQVNIGAGSWVTFSGTQALAGSGTVTFEDDDTSNSILVSGTGDTLTIGPNILVHGDSGTVNADDSAFINQGTISADAGGNITLNGTNWSNTGTIQAVNGSNIIASGEFTNLGTISGATGLIYLTGILNNSNTTLALNDSTQVYLERGTISGGTVTTAGGAELVGTRDGGTLTGVTLAGTLEMASPLLPASDAGQVTVTNGLTLSAGSIEFSESAVLTFEGSQSLSGTGTLTFANVTGVGGIAVTSGSYADHRFGHYRSGKLGDHRQQRRRALHQRGNDRGHRRRHADRPGRYQFFGRHLDRRHLGSGRRQHVAAGGRQHYHERRQYPSGRSLCADRQRCHRHDQCPGRVSHQRGRRQFHHPERRHFHLGASVYQCRHAHHQQRRHVRRGGQRRLHADRRHHHSERGNPGNNRKPDRHRGRYAFRPRHGHWQPHQQRRSRSRQQPGNPDRDGQLHANRGRYSDDQGRRRHRRQPVRSGQCHRHGDTRRHADRHARERLCARSRTILRRLELRQLDRKLRDIQFAADQRQPRLRDEPHADQPGPGGSDRRAGPGRKQCFLHAGSGISQSEFPGHVHGEQPGHGGGHKPELDGFCLSLNGRCAGRERRARRHHHPHRPPRGILAIYGNADGSGSCG